MGSFFSAFSTEVFRPLVTLLIPGGLAFSSWFIALLWMYPNLRNIVEKNHTESAFVLLLAMIFLGLIVEDLGAHTESHFDDLANNDTSGKHMENWYGYLRMSFKADPIGRRYVRTLVLRLKFELGVVWASTSAIVGVIWLIYLAIPWQRGVGIIAFLGVLGIWSFWEAKLTHDALAKNRAQLLQDIRIVG